MLLRGGGDPLGESLQARTVIFETGIERSLRNREKDQDRVPLAGSRDRLGRQAKGQANKYE